MDSKSQSIIAFLQTCGEATPSLAPAYAQMGELYKRKLWHQLTVMLEELVGKEEAAPQLIGVYHTFISDFKHRMNELALARIQVAVMLQYTDEAAAVAFGEKVAQQQSDDMEAGAFVLCELARLLLRFGQVNKCKDKLDLAAAKIEGAAGVTSEVQVRRAHGDEIYLRMSTAPKI
jgi:26S proteasome regulatory subunit N9